MRIRFRTAPLAVLGALAYLACDSPIRLTVVGVTPAVETPGASGSAGAAGSAGRAGAPAKPDAGVPAGGAGGAGGEPGDAGSGGEGGAVSGPPWEAEPLFVASYVSVAYPGSYIRHQDGEGWVSSVDPATEAEQGSFAMIPGLLDTSCLSFRDVGNQGYFLRHANSRVHFNLADDTPLFFGDATFCPEPGLADPDGVSFRSSNYPERYLHVRNTTELWIDDHVDTPEFAAESTFRRETAFVDR